MKATEQYFPVVLFIMLYKVVLAFELEEDILKCDHSNESHWAVLFSGNVSPYIFSLFVCVWADLTVNNEWVNDTSGNFFVCYFCAKTKGCFVILH